MLTIEVNIKDLGASAGIAALLRTCEHRTALHRAMAAGVEAEAQAHLRARNSRSPNTSFYGRAALSAQGGTAAAEISANESGATLTFTHRGLALRYYGGRVLPKDAKHLALPTKAVPLAGTEGRMPPREMGILAFLPRKKGADAGTFGYLVEGIEKPGRKRPVPKPGGKLFYVLRSWTDHKPDPTVLPTMADLIRAATAAGGAYVQDLTPP